MQLIVICTHTYTHIHAHTHAHTHTHTQTHACMQCKHMCMHACSLSHMHTHTHAHSHACMLAHTHSHTHICLQACVSCGCWHTFPELISKMGDRIIWKPYHRAVASAGTTYTHIHANTHLLRIPSFRLKSFGQRKFSYQASVLWNSLLISLGHSNSTLAFKSALKTHLFPSQ